MIRADIMVFLVRVCKLTLDTRKLVLAVWLMRHEHCIAWVK